MKKPLLTKKLLLPVTFLLAFFMGYYLSAYQFSLLRMAQELVLDNVQLGILAGTNCGSQILVPILFGILADKKGKKLFLAVSVGMLLVALFLFSVSGSYPTLLAVIFLASSGVGAIPVLYISMCADVYPDRVMKYTNLAQTVYSGGAFLAPLVSAQMEASGLRWTYFFVPVIVCLIIVAVMMVFLDAGKKPVLADTKAQASKIKASSVFKSSLFYTLIFWMMLYLGLENSTASFADSYFVRDLNSTEFAALALSLYWLMMCPSRLLFGLIKKNHINLLAAFSVGLIAVSAVIAYTGDPTVALVCFIISGFLCGPFWPTIFAYSQKAFPHATSTAGSFCTAFSGLGGFIFPAFLGGLSEGGSMSVIYYAIAVIGLGCFVFALISKRLMNKHSIPLT